MFARFADSDDVFLGSVAGALAIGSAAGVLLYKCHQNRGASQKELRVEMTAAGAETPVHPGSARFGYENPMRGGVV